MTDNQPIKYLDASSEDSKICQRCKAEKGVLISRKEPFCKNCFIRFIRGKQRKQMQDEKYKVKYGAEKEKLSLHKVLLVFSGGSSSLVLLDVMASLLQEQYNSHNTKQGFELVILNLDESDIDTLNQSIVDVLPELLKRYAPIKINYKVLSLSSYILDQSMLNKIQIDKDFSGIAESIEREREYSLKDLLSLCTNKSSAEDLLTIVYDELILRTAHLEGCGTILYGHSMTRIANEVIALTVKGRGSTIYQAISDHDVNFRDQQYKILFPLRDVLYAEIEAYVKLAELESFRIESQIQKSKITRNLTIRDLTTNYFTTLDATGYASTASTVVKTGEKLGAPKFDSVLCTCQICGVDIYQDPKSWLRRITVNKAAPIETDEERAYVQAYKEAFGEHSEKKVGLRPVDLCYGCIVTLGGVKQESGFIWPLKNDSQQALNNVYTAHNDQEILDEYILTDDEE